MTSTLLSEKIYESARTVVYRGKKVANGEPIIIKLMRNEYPSFRELVQFRNQYAIAKNLDLEGIVKCYGLERYDNRYALIMEDTGSISLAAYKQQQSLLSLRQFLDLAIQLSEIVHQLHNNSIIHKDIKPANILINPETKQIKLIDFSISTLLPKETQTLQTPNVLEGTLAYIAPEQTGRMNRGIDYRSDFYSLGVTFYELLAGALPFPTDDPLELIHAHLAQNPEPISEYICLGGDICPEPLADIVKKLMAKNAEDRYQSALGIKYDLEKCREQWEETGEIKPFELGERDLCDRFLIPEQLYGRETEVQTLLDVFERVAEGRSEMMLVAGFSGIGKTAVVNEVHKPIVRQRGYFIKGKFDQFNRNIPFSAFVQALRDLMGQLLSESDEQLARWRSQILTVVGDNGQVLLEMIPELESVIGKQPPVLELSGSAAQNRFNLLFEKFISVLTTKEHPLVIFLDDLQWADSASLNLMKVLMGDRDRGYLLLLGAYRDHEVFPAHPLLLTLRKLAQQEAAISTITLSPLSVDRVNQLVAETLSCTLEQAQPLTELVYQKTQGNPFFTTQFLKGLYQDELIVFNRTLGYWECDLVKVRDAALTDDVVEFMASRLQKLPEATQEVLKLAACIGNEFDLETLAVVCETTLEEVASELWSGLQEGVVVPISQAYKFFQSQIDSASFETVTVNYRFLHDRVQQAAYSLIAEAKKTQTHLKIGQLLWQHTDETQKDEKIFAIVNQFNYGLELINNDFERLQVAQLNAIAGHKAKVSTAYAAARQYLSTGINLLPTNSWQSEYQLTLNLYQEAVEAAYLNADFEQMEYLSQEVLKSAQTLLEKIKVYEVKIQAATAQNQMSTAIQTARLVLSFLGVEFPESPTSLDRERAMAKTASKLSGKNIEDLTDLPVMTDPEKLAMMKVLATVASAAYIGMPELYPLIVLKQVDISLEYGNTASSAYAYATYGLILCAFAEDIPGGSRSGELALQLLEKFQAKEYQAKILNLVHPFVRHWTSPLKDSLPSLLEGYQSGIETGDLEFAAYCIFNYCTFEYYSGNELSNLAAEMATYGQAIQQIEQQTALNFHNIIRQSVLNLLGKNNHPCLLVGNIYDENVMLPRHLEANDLYAVGSLYVSKLILNYLLDNNFEVVLEIAKSARKYVGSVAGCFLFPLFHFYDSLTQLAGVIQALPDQKETMLAQVKANQEKLKNWADSAPMNHLHKFDLVQAESWRVLGKKIQAIDLYDRAIAGAKENGYIQEEALANELFAKFYLDWGREKEAAVYMQAAYYCYAQWGAKAKTDALEQRYPELLKPILQRAGAASTSSTSLSTITSHSQTATIANISSLLDFSSLFKVSQTLSREIELKRLLSTLIKIILENAGATKGALFLESETGLILEAIATRNNDKLQLDSIHQSIPLADYSDLPTGLINYVRRTTETALLNPKTAQAQFATDTYIQRFCPLSLLCLPLLERGNLIGILYLENSLTADAFTSDRVELLDVVCAQAAISLSNARLYQKAQQALKDLQAAQLQLVQNEKMATLGNLVAGVAHEINNPVSFIVGNISAAQEHLQDLLSIITLYQENISLSASILKEIEDFDLEFIAQDFPKLITSMKTGCDRIRNISTSLRTFSRTDTNQKTKFNLHEGIESTLLILKYRLKANEQRPAIKIRKSYGDIPEVQCFPGQLNQVFMNLLANAIDAFEENNCGKSYSEIEQNPNLVIIETSRGGENQVQIKIQDNGCGMKAETVAHIFEQGFTTKGVGKGTGLGLAIAHQIITEKHRGTITCNSELGKGTTFAIALPLA